MASSLQVHACMPRTATASASVPFSSSRSCSFRGSSSFAEPRLSLSTTAKNSRKCVNAEAASAVTEAPSAVTEAPSSPALSSPPSSISSRPQKAKSSSKKQQVMLKFVWMEKNIGIAVDQVVPGQGTVPLSSYYFWPRKDAWEEIKTKLESKKWISKKQTILLLNQATDIINLWQQNASG